MNSKVSGGSACGGNTESRRDIGIQRATRESKWKFPPVAAQSFEMLCVGTWTFKRCFLDDDNIILRFLP